MSKRHPRRLTADEHRMLLSLAVLTAVQLAHEENQAAALGIGDMLGLITRAVYRHRLMKPNEWQAIDEMLVYFKEQEDAWQVELTDHAGIAPDELSSSDGSGGCSHPSHDEEKNDEN